MISPNYNHCVKAKKNLNFDEKFQLSEKFVIKSYQNEWLESDSSSSSLMSHNKTFKYFWLEFPITNIYNLNNVLCFYNVSRIFNQYFVLMYKINKFDLIMET